MKPRTAARLVAITAAVALAGSLSMSASAATLQARFEYGVDRTSWYWTQQEDRVIEAPDPLPFAHRQRVPNPQAAETLPVAVTEGKHEKISALYMNLFSRGIEAGATINRITLTIAEETAGREFPSYNNVGKVIQACMITGFLAAGEAEEWETAPEYDKGSCARGTRRAEGATAEWVFDLTRFGSAWGENPFANNGVMLVGVIGTPGSAQENWQINLKIPSRDDAATPVDENEQTKDRVVLAVSYQPGAGEPPIAPPPPPPPPPVFDAPPPPPPSVPDAPPPPEDPGPPAPPVNDGGGDAAEPVGDSSSDPKKALVWALLPIGLMTLAGVRSSLFEPAGGIRQDGVVAAIRRRNAARRS